MIPIGSSNIRLCPNPSRLLLVCAKLRSRCTHLKIGDEVVGGIVANHKGNGTAGATHPQTEAERLCRTEGEAGCCIGEVTHGVAGKGAIWIAETVSGAVGGAYCRKVVVGTRRILEIAIEAIPSHQILSRHIGGKLGPSRNS